MFVGAMLPTLQYGMQSSANTGAAPAKTPRDNKTAKTIVDDRMIRRSTGGVLRTGMQSNFIGLICSPLNYCSSTTHPEAFHGKAVCHISGKSRDEYSLYMYA